jgi:hypothetical protein
MTIQYAKHVKLICDLKQGDIVRTNNYGKPLDGKSHVVESVMFMINCESGFMVTLKDHPNMLDSNWLIKVEKK